MEASPHAWFGAETSNLHLAIDDAWQYPRGLF